MLDQIQGNKELIVGFNFACNDQRIPISKKDQVDNQNNKNSWKQWFDGENFITKTDAKTEKIVRRKSL